MHVTPQLSSLALSLSLWIAFGSNSSLSHSLSLYIFPQTGYSFGYGFVDYNSEADTEEAIDKLNGYYVRNKRLKVCAREGEGP